jgi:hypothetical protein
VSCGVCGKLTSIAFETTAVPIIVIAYIRRRGDRVYQIQCRSNEESSSALEAILEFLSVIGRESPDNVDKVTSHCLRPEILVSLALVCLPRRGGNSTVDGSFTNWRSKERTWVQLSWAWPLVLVGSLSSYMLYKRCGLRPNP